MKVNFRFPNIKNIFPLVVGLLFIIFNMYFNKLNALAMNNYQSELVTEELRLKVPSDKRDVWLKAEKNIWEPWLSSQEGFMGRQIFWDKEKEEALILVKWENRRLWKNISMKEVNDIQKKFEENVMLALKLNENPFKLIYEGELHKQR